MSKRNNTVQTGPESDALKLLRKKEGVSIRKLADLMEISHTRVHQMESGREDISADYIEKFLSTLKIKGNEWDKLTRKRNKKIGPRELCMEFIKGASKSQLEDLYVFIKTL